MDQCYLPFLYVVSKKMIPHFYVLGFGRKNWVLCYTFGTGAVTLKWNMGILLTKSLRVYVIQRSLEQQLAATTYSASVVD
jgi:hypothetical protein